MMKAIFTEEFNYSSRKTNAGWSIKPSKNPQSFPREVVEAAISAGRATAVDEKSTAKK